MDLSLNEWVVLALLAEAPTHGFAVARELRPDRDLGRILTVHRPLVYRALARLVAAGLAEPFETQPGDAGPARTLHRPTRRGRAALAAWFVRPVEHIRDLRIEFLAKVRLSQRAGRDPGPLLDAQSTALASAFDRVISLPDEADVVDLWRHHAASAALRFLDDLAQGRCGAAPDRP